MVSKGPIQIEPTKKDALLKAHVWKQYSIIHNKKEIVSNSVTEGGRGWAAPLAAKRKNWNPFSWHFDIYYFLGFQ